MPLQGTHGLYFPVLLRQTGAAMYAFSWQHRHDSVRLGIQWPVLSHVTGLTARLPLTLAMAVTWPLFASQAVGGRRFGGIGRVLLPGRQLALQVRDLFLGVGDLFLGVGDLLLLLGVLPFGLLILLPQSLILPPQLFPRGPSRTPIGRPILPTTFPGGSRSHPP